MSSRFNGIVLLSLGIAYLCLVAWLFSWWYVPAYRDVGPGITAAPDWFGGDAPFIVWAISGPLGSLLVILGAGLCGGIGSRRFVLFLLGGVALALCLSVGSFATHQPVLYGIGGGVITACFIVNCVLWARARAALSSLGRTGSDLRAAGNLLFYIAAWGLCGLLGAPTYAVRPELSQQFGNTAMTSDMAVKVLVCLVLGWILHTLGHWCEQRAGARSIR